MTTADLKPGDLVRHPEWGPGLVGGGKQILYLARDGFVYAAFDPDGWERVENCTTDERRILDGLCGRYHVFLAEKLDADEQGDARGGDRETERASGWFTCPWCQESVAAIHLASRDANGCVVPLSLSTSHRCPPVQPDEPTEFGAKATVAQADGHIERWLNMHAPPQGRRGWLTWDARDTAGSTPGQSKWADWSEIIQRGTVTLGWDE